MQRVASSLSVYSTPDRGDVAQNKTLNSDLNSSAQGLINSLKARLPSLSVTQFTEKRHNQNRPKVVCIEWTDPLMATGNWVPELVALAGGEDVCGLHDAALSFPISRKCCMRSGRDSITARRPSSSYRIQLPISFRLRPHPKQRPVSPSTAQTLIQGLSMSGRAMFVILNR